MQIAYNEYVLHISWLVHLRRRRADQRFMPRRYEPRSLLVRPEFFGVKDVVEWRSWDEAGNSRVAEAYFHHRMAVAVIGKYKIDEVAELLGKPFSQVRRKLRGEVPLTFGDVVAWPLLLGVDVLPKIGSRDDLLPVIQSKEV